MNINLDEAVQAARQRDLALDNPEDLLDNKEFLSLIHEHVAELNSHLAGYETIKRYTIIRYEFSKETGELTATLKMKRKVVQEKYRDIIDSMYNSDESVGVVAA